MRSSVTDVSDAAISLDIITSTLMDSTRAASASPAAIRPAAISPVPHRFVEFRVRPYAPSPSEEEALRACLSARLQTSLVHGSALAALTVATTPTRTMFSLPPAYGTVASASSASGTPLAHARHGSQPSSLQSGLVHISAAVPASSATAAAASSSSRPHLPLVRLPLPPSPALQVGTSNGTMHRRGSSSVRSEGSPGDRDTETEEWRHLISIDVPTSSPTVRGSPSSVLPCTPQPKYEWVEFLVRDNGMGMSEQIVQDIFTPYSASKLKTYRSRGGTGLGLSICKEIVSQMGGQIFASSVEGEGSTVTVRLPFQVAEPSDLLLSDTPMLRAELDHSSHEEAKEPNRETHSFCGVGDGGGPVPLQHSVRSVVPSHPALQRLPTPPAFSPPFQSLVSALSTAAASSSGWTVPTPPNLQAQSDLSHTSVQTVRHQASPPMTHRPDADSGFFLPVPNVSTAVSPSPIPSSSATGTPAVTSFRILVVDDNEINRKLLSRMLKSLHYEVDTAEDGRLAVEAVQRNMVDFPCPSAEHENADSVRHYQRNTYCCIFMDISMPVMDVSDCDAQWHPCAGLLLPGAHADIL